jgi:hypothetical protein
MMGAEGIDAFDIGLPWKMPTGFTNVVRGG